MTEWDDYEGKNNIDYSVVSRLQTLYKECDRAQKEKHIDAYRVIGLEFAEVLKKCKEFMPDDKDIQEISDVIPTGVYADGYGSANITEIRMKTKRLLDIIGIETHEEILHKPFDANKTFESSKPIQQPPSTPITVQVLLFQSLAHLSIQSIDSVMANINTIVLSPEIRIEIETHVKEFEKEISKDTPDKNKMHKIVKEVGKISKEAALILLKYALDKGWLDKLF